MLIQLEIDFTDSGQWHIEKWRVGQTDAIEAAARRLAQETVEKCLAEDRRADASECEALATRLRGIHRSLRGLARDVETKKLALEQLQDAADGPESLLAIPPAREALAEAEGRLRTAREGAGECHERLASARSVTLRNHSNDVNAARRVARARLDHRAKDLMATISEAMTKGRPIDVAAMLWGATIAMNAASLVAVAQIDGPALPDLPGPAPEQREEARPWWDTATAGAVR